MGPILPQINVFGKELGISPQVMGYVTCIMPILYVIAKPAVGFLADYFSVGFEKNDVIGKIIINSFIFRIIESSSLCQLLF